MEGKLKTLKEQLEKTREEWIRIVQEIEDIELEGLYLPGKYLYSEIKEVYIHVSKAWLGNEDGDRWLYLIGETLSFSDDPCYFDWDLKNEIRSSFRNYSEEWKEIDENKSGKVKKTAIITLNRY